MPVCKNRFVKFARIFSRRQFSDAAFLGILRVKALVIIAADNIFMFLVHFSESLVGLDISFELSARQMADYSHEMLILIFSEKIKKETKMRISSTAN